MPRLAAIQASLKGHLGSRPAGDQAQIVRLLFSSALEPPTGFWN